MFSVNVNDCDVTGLCVLIDTNAARPLSSVAATLVSVGTTEMLRTLNVTGLLQLFTDGNHTVFAPTNEALASFTPRSV